MKILPTKTSTAICILAVASLPCAFAQEENSEAAPSPDSEGPAIEGEAHENLSNIDKFIESRLNGIALTDPDRVYGPLGVIKDGAMEQPAEVIVETPNNTGTTETPQPVNQLKETVDALVITGFNAGGGKILLGINEISVGQTIPGSNDIVLSAVSPNKLTFKSKSSGEVYQRPVGFSPGGVQSRDDFLNSVDGITPR